VTDPWYWLKPWPQHDLLKPRLLTMISEDHATDYRSRDNDINRTDWPRYSLDSAYKDLFHREIMRFLNLNFDRHVIDIIAIWYQQYETNNFHDWHDHRGEYNYNLIYYLDLPPTAPRTEYRRPFDTTPRSIPASEGDVVIMMSTLSHRSTALVSADSKTVILANLSIDPE